MIEHYETAVVTPRPAELERALLLEKLSTETRPRVIRKILRELAKMELKRSRSEKFETREVRR